METTTFTTITQAIRNGSEFLAATLVIIPTDDNGRVECVLHIDGDDFTPADYGHIIIDLLTRNDMLADNWDTCFGVDLQWRAFDNADGFPSINGRFINDGLYLI